jgi:polyphosphate kinase
MFGRIEVSWPVRDRALRRRVIDECIVPYLLDGKDAWLLGSDGTYERAAAGERSAQEALLGLYTGDP